MAADSVSTAPRNTLPPKAQAGFGVGVVVQARDGRILLGRHRDGTWELPGGKIDPTHESVAAAAARELREETGLAVAEEAVTIFAMVHDVVAGINRISMAAHVAVGAEVAEVTEPHLISAWRWTEPDALPGPLFHPSAQILAVWRPDLGIAHPPAHHLAITPSSCTP
ncbi:NUDIX domain-containing protein [Streptomyces clavifer]|uniref:nucleotide triphosphate diphosphatase NUDT15 n=1 Tax=Streptomyces TaxID=1883 RepID=UPI0007003507|nr:MULTISPECIES: NUDIX domain-containing protein [unclassified Streptomyces]KQX78391.1 DNA mismatch repair protein MutT [Streptomyces sp. Root1319]KQZ03158.1 DNA mismatch repair protein MutT [Streptomyces sp. Root55]